MIDETADCVREVLRAIGEDPDREGLRDTPTRFVKALREATAGYAQDPLELLRTFGDGAEGYDEMVVVRDIQFYSLCEHHLAPFFGTATIAYVPSGRVVGLSKLVRLTDVFARRLQVQERMTAQIADAIVSGLHPKGVGVILRARHMCMEARGVRRAGAQTVTSALRGVFTNPETRAEFLNLHGA